LTGGWSERSIGSGKGGSLREPYKEEKVREEIKSFIVNNFMMGRNPEDLTDSDSLLDKGIIDSTGVLELVGFIEEKFNVQVQDEELVPENLDSVNNLITYIQKKKGMTA
jgi:acyl carrier protein